MHLGWLDIIVLVAYLASAIGIGLWVSGRARGFEAYLLGDRDLPWWAILGSIVATETSTATVLSVPGEAAGVPGNPDMPGYGMRFLQLAIGYIVGRTIIVRVLLPLYFRGKLFTAYQVLHERFGGLTQRAASLLFLVTRNLGDGLRLYLASLVLQQLAGWRFDVSVIAMGAVTIVYTYFGGMRSVVWNDCIQLVIYMLGGVAAVFVIVSQIPGQWDELFRFAAAEHRFSLFNFDFDLAEKYTFWAGLIGGAVLTIGTHGTDHMMVQRYLSARSQRDAGLAILSSGFVVFAQFALFLFIGVELACYYYHHPTSTITKPDQVFADFIVHHFPQNVGLVGLMLAAILAAAMSTLSSSLNSSASALVNDFYLPLRRTKPSPEHLFWVTRNLTIAFGVLQSAIGIGAQYLAATVVTSALTIASFAAGLLLGVFALGVLTRRADQASALIGGAAGLAVLLTLQFVAPGYGIKVAWPWFALVGAATTFVTGYAVAIAGIKSGIKSGPVGSDG